MIGKVSLTGLQLFHHRDLLYLYDDPEKMERKETIYIFLLSGTFIDDGVLLLYSFKDRERPKKSGCFGN